MFEAFSRGTLPRRAAERDDDAAGSWTDGGEIPMDREPDFLGAADVRRCENLQVVLTAMRWTRFAHGESTPSLALASFAAA
jgi:hypothetical protein